MKKSWRLIQNSPINPHSWTNHSRILKTSVVIVSRLIQPNYIVNIKKPWQLMYSTRLEEISIPLGEFTLVHASLCNLLSWRGCGTKIWACANPRGSTQQHELVGILKSFLPKRSDQTTIPLEYAQKQQCYVKNTRFSEKTITLLPLQWNLRTPSSKGKLDIDFNL